MLLTKESILAAQDLKRETVSVPEWGGELIVSEMGGADLERFFEATQSDDRRIDFAYVATALVFCVVDEAGDPVFTLEDVPRLARRKKAVLWRVFEAVDRLNLLTAKAQQEAQKNSSGEADGAEGSSASPANSDCLPSGTSSES